MNYKNNVSRRQNYPQNNRRPNATYQAPACPSPLTKDTFTSLAMVYPISQCWRLICDGKDGFERGTIFDELNKPFVGDKCKKGNC